MIRRVIVLGLILLVGAGVIVRASRVEVVPSREPLDRFPFVIDQWRGRNTEPFTAEVLAVLGADEYLSRVYVQDRTSIASLYIGFYESQRQGDSIHSPLNCLPGAGWQPVARSYVTIPVTTPTGPADITVNRYVIEKGLDRQVVLYWYQSHGRVVANEYRSKAFMIFDAIRLNRSDAALVRVISPRLGTTDAAEEAANAQAIQFVKDMFPLLDRFLPS